MTPHRNILALTAALFVSMPVLARAEGADKAPKGTFVPVPGLAATILRPGGGHGVMSVEAGVDAPDPGLHAYVLLELPRLEDAYTQVLQAYGGALRPATPPDADYVARQLQTATDHILGRPGARLLLGGIMVN
jgi:hypothetical protein